MSPISCGLRPRLIAGAIVALATVSSIPAHAGIREPDVSPSLCAGWSVETVATGLDEPENLEPDGAGGFYISGDSSIVHVDTDGRVEPVLDDLPAPRGMQLHDGILYFVAGPGLSQFDTRTGEVSPVTDMAAHGLLRLPNGDFLTTDVGTDIGSPSRGLTRYHPDADAVEVNWSPVPRSEGLALSPDHSRVYTDDLFTGQVIEVPLEAPDNWSVVATVPGIFPGLDDLTMSDAGVLYAAAHVEGAVYSIDPLTGASCVIAAGMSPGWTGPSSVRIGPSSDGWALYATVFDGTLRRLTPPTGVDIEPVRP
ncbi:SMP-30/gluconolactonase/LRE family protein [Rhodococcus ruber]|uniref:SMP-30/gluconolactonase/LRE family protein n=1 Tax=Rhodococcus ruber TaxID=1830 RepID=A0ABT4MB59_9NOCA|nr:SMP-30/gluconolactonase/LRE family protein [Rhodococcus ruber]MCZ4518103.1 SMP-30/gluconolactonase/LRE family protein [Rhodococcus ruber]